MRVVLIGAGDADFHYEFLLSLTKEKISQHCDEIALALAESGAEIVLLPDRGICFDIAKKFKEFGGKKVIGVVPKSDKKFGINHLKAYIDFELKGKKLFDEIIDSGDWYSANQTHCLFGENILVIGFSLGSLGELSFGYYMYKLFSGGKPEVNVDLSKFNKNFVAGKRIPFDTIIYSPLAKGKLPFETEKYIEKFGSKVIYVNNQKQLKKIISE